MWRHSHYQICYFFAILLGYNRDISAPRQKLADEITPVRAEHSRTYEDYEMFAAAHAIDLDLETRSMTGAGSDGTVWLEIILDQVYCVQQVIWYKDDGSSYNTWTCSETDCSKCEGNHCHIYRDILTVSSKETAQENPSHVSGCKYGDTVKLAKSTSFYVYEIAIIGRKLQGDA